MKQIFIKLIKIYQRTLSPDTGWFSSLFPGGYCKFEPHCSQYCIDAIERYGIIKGVYLGVWRILRCNPWSKGGNDPA